MSTNVEYALRQLRKALEDQRVPSRAADRVQRAIDALEREAQSGLRKFTVEGSAGPATIHASSEAEARELFAEANPGEQIVRVY